MPKSEDGEFELVLGNRQILSVFFIVVVLLGLCFLMGYVVGRSTAPPILAENTAEGSESSPTKVIPTAGPDGGEQPPDETAGSEANVSTVEPPDTAKQPPAQTAPQQSEPPQQAKSEAPPAKQTPSPTPPKASPPKQTASTSSQPPVSGTKPIPGRLYLQLSATDLDRAELFVERLRRDGFPSIAAQVPERPALYRVLVGPLEQDGLTATRDALREAGYAADIAISRTY